MKKFTKSLIPLLCSILFLLALINETSAYNKNLTTISKIDPTFPEEVFTQSKKFPVIIELMDEPVVSYSLKLFNKNFLVFREENFSPDYLDKDYEVNLIKAQNDFMHWMKKNEIYFNFRVRCTNVINSLSINVKGWDIPRLLKNPAVKMIHNDDIVFYPNRAIAAQTTGASKVWKGESGFRATGKGILVGVIDSGIERNHPEFKGKIKGGYDLADGDGDFQDADFHGTMVAGIIGGLGDKDYLRGMGYNANFMIYKVFSTKFQGGREIIPAIDRAVADRCNIMNLSLGTLGPFDAKGSSAYHTAIRNATKANIMVVCATGNSGSRSNLLSSPIGPPAGVDDAFAVACSDDRTLQLIKVVKPEEKIITGRKVPFTPPFRKELSQVSLVDCGYGKETDFNDAAGKIALVKRGPQNKAITFKEKILNAKKAGARAIIIYNYDSTGLITPTVFASGENPYSIELLPSAFIAKEDGEFLLSSLTKDLKLFFEEGSGVSMAEYSSMGPTADAVFKPEISAPGSYIYTTYPEKYGFYGMGHGTSSASPMAAGLVALIKEAHPEWKIDEIKSAFMNTATILKNPYNGKPISFLLQGAGEADVGKAINTSCFINPRAVVIEEAKNASYDFTLKNISKGKVEFPLNFEIFLEKEDKNPLKIDILPNTITANSGESKKFSVKFSIDNSKFEKDKIEGIIKVGELHIPFVILKDSAEEVPDQISNVKINPSDIYFTKENTTSNIDISFSFNFGNKHKFKDIEGATDYASNYGDLRIALTDMSGEEWTTISNFSGCLVGDYKIRWNGRNKNELLFLPQGKYYLQFITKELTFSESGTETRESTAARVPFEVKDSLVPKPLPLIFSTLSKYKLKEEFLINLYIDSISNLKGLELSLSYDARKLSCKEVIQGNFISQNEPEEGNEIYSEIYDDIGIVNIKILKNEKIPNNGRIKIASIRFKGVDKGKPRFKCINSFFLVEDEFVIKIDPVYPKLEITDKDFLLADLNNDKRTDSLDFEVFSSSFDSKKGEKQYNDACDFNQDEFIDLNDLIVIGREFGRSI